MERVEAVVDCTTYRNHENGYSVVSLKHGKGSITAVGILPQLTAGEQVVLFGEWVRHPKFGRQLRCEGCEVQKPTTLLGIERFLGSGLISGVGPSTAKAIVEHFGARTLDILSEEPERLTEVKGIGRKRALMIAASYQERYGEREAMVFLQGYGIPPALAAKIARLYGDQTQEVIRTNPYRLCTELDGVGFRTADRIAASVGIAPESEFRIRSAVTYMLMEAAATLGHCCLPEALLLSRTAELLSLPEEAVARELDALRLAREIVAQTNEAGEPLLYLPHFEAAEKEVALRLCELMAAGAAQAPHDAAGEIAAFEKAHGIGFGGEQREAIAMALRSSVLVITGGPGTGKTTIIRCIISLLGEDGSVKLCAPTGRAARRMSEATGEEALTIHRLLEYGGAEGAFARNQENPIESDCIIVDEMSMVDLMLMRSLLRAAAPGTRLILVGDADQLPSVGAGNVLGDLLASGVIPQIRLTEIYRQDEHSCIVTNAHRINRGELPLLNGKGSDFFFVREDSLPRAAEVIRDLVTERLPRFTRCAGREEIIRTIQVLAPAKKGDCGVWALNLLLQEALNPACAGEDGVKYGETVFRKGDKVMQTRNDYELAWRRHTRGGWTEGKGVFNGDIGYITEADEEEHRLTVLFDEEKQVIYEGQQMESLELAYCLSVHKSQGSEFPVVVMPVVSGPPLLQTRNLFYTALTRARSLVVLVGREDVIRCMVENNTIRQRYTTLTERLRQYAAVYGS